MRDKLVRKVLEYRDRLEDLLRDERIVYSLLSDQTIRDDFLFVVGALKIRVPLTVLAAAPGASSRSRPVSSRVP